jgi:hypothetical protein
MSARHPSRPGTSGPFAAGSRQARLSHVVARRPQAAIGANRPLIRAS